MVKKNKKSSRKNLKRSLHRQFRHWHRKLGILTALFLVFLSFSGILINHSHELSLDQLHVKQPWLLSYYGLKKPSNTQFFAHKQITVTDNLVWLNDKLLFESDAKIVSAIEFSNEFVIATETMLFVYSKQGELLDQLDEYMGLPVPIVAMGKEKSQLIVQTTNAFYSTDKWFTDWHQLTAHLGRMQKGIAGNNQDQTIATRLFQSHFLSWEQIILDAHSGRIFGRFGVYFSDFIAVLLMLLSFSGIYIWFKHLNKTR